MRDGNVFRIRDGRLYYRHYGLWYKVLYVAENDADANSYMGEIPESCALESIRVNGVERCIIVNKRDNGVKAP